MHVEIDQLRGLPNAANRRFLNRFPFAHQRNYASVVVRIHLAVQQINSVHFHGGNNGVNFGLVASFGKIRHTFH